jgi:hypothetical protein
MSRMTGRAGGEDPPPPDAFEPPAQVVAQPGAGRRLRERARREQRRRRIAGGGALAAVLVIGGAVAVPVLGRGGIRETDLAVPAVRTPAPPAAPSVSAPERVPATPPGVSLPGASVPADGESAPPVKGSTPVVAPSERIPTPPRRTPTPRFASAGLIASTGPTELGVPLTGSAVCADGTGGCANGDTAVQVAQLTDLQLRSTGRGFSVVAVLDLADLERLQSIGSAEGISGTSISVDGRHLFFLAPNRPGRSIPLLGNGTRAQANELLATLRPTRLLN